MSHNNPNWWMEYLPDFMSPLGMVFYSFITFLLLAVHKRMRRKTVEEYVDKSMRASMKKSVE